MEKVPGVLCSAGPGEAQVQWGGVRGAAQDSTDIQQVGGILPRERRGRARGPGSLAILLQGLETRCGFGCESVEAAGTVRKLERGS